MRYDRPLWSAIKAETDGEYCNAALTWLRALEDPAKGAEAHTEREVGELQGDCEQLCEMLDWLFIEHEAMLSFIAKLDVETIHEATSHWGTDDTGLIRVLATRNKRCLQNINIGYRTAYEEPLQVG